MKNVYLKPKNETPINELYAVLSVDNDGCEGIVSAITPMGAMPMVFSNKRMLDITKEKMKEISSDAGVKLRICKFTTKEIIEEVAGNH